MIEDVKSAPLFANLHETMPDIFQKSQERKPK